MVQTTRVRFVWVSLFLVAGLVLAGCLGGGDSLRSRLLSPGAAAAIDHYHCEPGEDLREMGFTSNPQRLSEDLMRAVFSDFEPLPREAWGQLLVAQEGVECEDRGIGYVDVVVARFASSEVVDEGIQETRPCEFQDQILRSGATVLFTFDAGSHVNKQIVEEALAEQNRDMENICA